MKKVEDNNTEEIKQRIRDAIKEKKEREEKVIEPEPPKELEQKPAGLTHQIKDLNEKMGMILGEKADKKMKKKTFKFPSKVKRQLKKLAKKNKLQVILLQHNKNIKPTIGELKEGMLFIGNKIYDGSTDCVWLWNGKFPTAIVAEWDLKPLTSDRLYTKTIEDNSISHPQTIMIRAMELKEVMQQKAGIGGKTLIWILIGGVIVFYVLFAKS